VSSADSGNLVPPGVVLSDVNWDERGLAAAICQDAGTGQALMLAWTNEEALRLTLEKGTVYFWSRSREKIWHKGETSGNFLRLVSASLDCDRDTLLFIVRPDGPACHTGQTSCFFNKIGPLDCEFSDGESPGDDLVFHYNLLETVYNLILRRRESGKAEYSYVARIFERGEERILEKVGEEAEEVARAVREEGQERVVSEMADLWFHSLLALALKNIPPGEVFAELARRFGKGGRPESH